MPKIRLRRDGIQRARDTEFAVKLSSARPTISEVPHYLDHRRCNPRIRKPLLDGLYYS